ARVVSNSQGTDVTVTSDLKGLASTLPTPAAKTAEEARALTIRIERPGQDAELANATLEGGLHWRSSRYAPGGADRWQVALKMGAPIAGEPARDGLRLYGAAPVLDADAWFGVFTQPRPAAAMATPPGPRPGGLELRGIDMRIGRARYLNRDFVDVAARLDRNGPRWEGSLESPLVAGTLQWYPEGKGRLVARLSRLSVPESKALPSTLAPESAEADLPAIDVQAEKFDFRGYYLGRLDMQAQNVGDEWRIDKLDIDNDHAHFRSSGGWRRTGTGAITSLSIALDSDNLNALMGQFGWGDYMKRGSGKLAGTLAWPGLPHEFSTSILSGGFKVEAKRGQFAKLEPGAGKLLGLLSLQSLPRRALFDFRDVFSDGFAFETIEGDVKVARGILVTDNFEISGPSAFVSLSGDVSLPLETQRLTLRVVPEVGEGMALAATLLGTPVLGLSTLLVSKLLRNPFGKAVAYEYQVTGSWDNPSVTRLSAPPAPPAKAAVAAEAQK
ncbi:MAG: AsmA-like C-terminal region-containing protein, partial [Usitatibacter sp.]